MILEIILSPISGKVGLWTLGKIVPAQRQLNQIILALVKSPEVRLNMGRYGSDDPGFTHLWTLT